MDYLIPAAGISIDEIVKTLGVAGKGLNNVIIEIIIDRVDDETLQKITTQAELRGYEILFPPVRFTSLAKTKTADGSEKEVNISILAALGEEKLFSVPGSLSVG